VLHNLVYVLVKLQDFNAAESILQQEKMADRSDGLMEALAKVNPRPRARSATLSAAAPVSIAESAAPAVKSGELAARPCWSERRPLDVPRLPLRMSSPGSWIISRRRSRQGYRKKLLCH
jgi:hypothetical protein